MKYSLKCMGNLKHFKTNFQMFPSFADLLCFFPSCHEKIFSWNLGSRSTFSPTWNIKKPNLMGIFCVPISAIWRKFKHEIWIISFLYQKRHVEKKEKFWTSSFFYCNTMLSSFWEGFWLNEQSLSRFDNTVHQCAVSKYTVVSKYLPLHIM